MLVVEDEPAVRRMIGRILGRAGYRLIEAPSGAAALALLETEQPDLVIADVVMPGLSGPELAVRMRARHPALKVLYISGYGEDVIERHGRGRRPRCFPSRSGAISWSRPSRPPWLRPEPLPVRGPEAARPDAGSRPV